MSDNEFKVGDAVTLPWDDMGGNWVIAGIHKNMAWVWPTDDNNVWAFGPAVVGLDRLTLVPPPPPLPLVLRGDPDKSGTWRLEDGRRWVDLSQDERNALSGPVRAGLLVIPDFPWQYPGGPERWVNIYTEGFGGAYCMSRADADLACMARRTEPGSFAVRIGVLHLFPDGHTEMEAP